MKSSSPIHRRPALAVLLALAFCGGWGVAPAGAKTLVSGVGPEVGEHDVKAAFLYNFAKFTTWPEKAFADAQAPIVVGILGPDPFGSVIDVAFQGKKAGRRDFVIERYATLERVKAPHVLFVGGDAEAELGEIRRVLDGRPVLLVGEVEGFARAGGVAGFYIDKKKVRFEVNVAAARRAELVISAQLLKLARVVES